MNKENEQLLEKEKWLNIAKIVNITTIIASGVMYLIISVTNIIGAFSLQILLSLIYMLTTSALVVFAIVTAVKLKDQNVKGIALMLVSTIITAILSYRGLTIFLLTVFFSLFSMNKMKESKDEVVLREKMKKIAAQKRENNSETEHPNMMSMPEIKMKEAAENGSESK